MLFVCSVHFGVVVVIKFIACFLKKERRGRLTRIDDLGVYILAIRSTSGSLPTYRMYKARVSLADSGSVGLSPGVLELDSGLAFQSGGSAR